MNADQKAGLALLILGLAYFVGLTVWWLWTRAPRAIRRALDQPTRQQDVAATDRAYAQWNQSTP